MAGLVERSLAELGRVDVFFANAGTDVGRGLDTPEAAWATALEVNVPRARPRGAAPGPPLAGVEPRRGRTESGVGEGRFVVTASAAGLLTMLGSAPYSVSKHGAVAFAEWLRATYGHRGIVVQAICPQGVRTRMLDEAGPLKELLSRDRALEPEEVADVVWEALRGRPVPRPAAPRGGGLLPGPGRRPGRLAGRHGPPAGQARRGSVGHEGLAGRVLRRTGGGAPRWRRRRRRSPDRGSSACGSSPLRRTSRTCCCAAASTRSVRIFPSHRASRRVARSWPSGPRWPASPSATGWSAAASSRTARSRPRR